MRSGIYKFTNLITGTVYIGSSVDIDKRYRQHLKSTKLSCARLRKAINKHGIENFTFELSEKVMQNSSETKEEFSKRLYFIEQAHLDKYFAQEYITSGGKDRRFTNLTYNLNPIASGGRGRKWTIKEIENLKKRNRERGHSCIGRKYSKSTINKMKATHRLRQVSVGSKNPNYGKKSTTEKRNKVIQIWLKNGRLKPFIAINKNGKEYGPFLTSSECGEALDLWKCQIKRCLSGKYKSAKGYTFKHIHYEESSSKQVSIS